MSSTEWTVEDGKLEVWEQRWRDDQLRWHKDQINPYLVKYIDLLTSLEPVQVGHNKGTKSTASKKFFIPLCGKTKDIAYILSLGHSVFAIEGVKQAIETLNQENLFGLVFDPKESIYSTEDGKLKIFLGNMFTCPIEKWGPFDCIWDRGSLTAIEVTFRSAYIDVMKRSVQEASGNYKQFRYLLQAFNYDKTKTNDRGPKCVDEQDMEMLYGDWTDFKLLEKVQLPKGHVIRTMVIRNGGEDDDSTSSCETIHILQNKLSS